MLIDVLVNVFIVQKILRNIKFLKFLPYYRKVNRDFNVLICIMNHIKDYLNVVIPKTI